MAKILIVEDDAQTASEIAKYLKAAGHTCAVRDGGRGIVELAKKGPPDLVVLDIMMPDVSGFEVCRSIRRDKDLYSLPILIVSAMNNDEEVQHGLIQGADAYITKPFDAKQLVLQVDAMLRENTESAHRDPLTDLADFEGIKRELRRRIGTGDSFALIYIELINLREVSKAGGSDVRNAALQHLSRVLIDAGAGIESRGFFVGHMGGWHFMCTLPTDATHSFCTGVQSTWEERLAELCKAAGLPQPSTDVREAEGTGKELQVLLCVTVRDPKERVTAQQMLDIVSRIRNNRVQTAEGGIHVDRRL